MNCKKFKAQIFRFQDGQLTRAQLDEFTGHQRQCHSCAEIFSGLEETAACLAATDPVPVPDFDKAWRRIEAAIEPRPKFSFRLSPRLALLSSGFLAFFIMGVVAARIFLFTPAKPAQQPAGTAEGFTFTVQDYFTALQPVISEYVNTSMPATSSAPDRDRVRRFLGNLYMLKLRAEKSKDIALQHLLADIELVLLEIAHLDRSKPGNSRWVGALIQEKGIAMKMKVFKFADRKSVRI